ncbi:MAG: tRNA lysidine(34) synthetase TilS [Gammaproteobacteria bacterium]|nr:tRNA lysidine(34) synthetase TilS [Gammaproteobacteria bacterium]
MSFIKRFQQSLESFQTPPEKASYVVAFSGGVDSHVLLHCCKKLNLHVRAVHVHHGLQSMADDWVAHCQKICNALEIHLDIIYVDAKKQKGQSPEESARLARYHALQNNLTSGDYLLTAQHVNDQAETLLIQLFRTASSAGLSAMPVSKKIGNNIHLRPLLTFPRHEIEEYAEQADLCWVEDPSNRDISFDRNYIRKNVLPMLEQRWPDITAQLATAANLQAKNLQVLEDMAAIDLANVIYIPKVASVSKISLFDTVSVLSMKRLKTLSSARLLNALRYWVRQFNRLLSRKLLEEIEKTIVNAQQDTTPVITFFEFEFRRFKHGLYLLKLNKDSLPKVNATEIAWVPSSPITLSDLNIKLSSVLKVGEGLNKTLLNETLIIKFRQGGESFHPAHRQHSQRLKKLFQESNVPPWDRDLIPLVYYKDALIAVAGLWVCKQHSVRADEEGWVVELDSC